MTQWSISIVYVGIYHVSLKIRLSSTIYDYMSTMPLTKIEMYHLMGFGLFSYDYIYNSTAMQLIWYTENMCCY